MGYRDERSDWPDVPRDVMADEIDSARAEAKDLRLILEAIKEWDIAAYRESGKFNLPQSLRAMIQRGTA